MNMKLTIFILIGITFVAFACAASFAFFSLLSYLPLIWQGVIMVGILGTIFGAALYHDWDYL